MPILPKSLHVHPKKGELVMIFANSVDDLYGNKERWFIGPIITQLDKLHFQDSQSAKSVFKDGFFKPGPNPSFYTGSKGVFPEQGDKEEEFGDNIAILGRHNEDIILTDTEIWIRSGVHKKEGDALVFDRPAYIKQKRYDSPISYTNNVNKTYQNISIKKMSSQTVTTIVADEINLISCSKDVSNQSKSLELYDNEELIKEDTMKRILESCHRLPFGDVLIEFLSEFMQVFLNHVHVQGNAQLPPDPVLSHFSPKFLTVDFNEMISNNVRIN
jgi:hypothetical protein